MYSPETMMRKNIPGASPYEPIIGFSRAVRVGNSVLLSGTGPVGGDDFDAAGQTRRIFEIAGEALALGRRLASPTSFAPACF